MALRPQVAVQFLADKVLHALLEVVRLTRRHNRGQIQDGAAIVLTGVLCVEEIKRHRREDLLEERHLLVICKLGYYKVHKLSATLADCL